MTPPKQPKKRNYQQHGLTALKNAFALVGSVEEWPDELKEAGAALAAKREKMIQEQGGGGVITEIERDAIDAKLQTTVLRHWVWNYIRQMECPVNKVKRTPFPVVEKFVSLVRAESESAVSLSVLREKRPKPEPVLLTDYLQSKAKHGPPDPQAKSTLATKATGLTTNGDAIPTTDKETTHDEP